MMFSFILFAAIFFLPYLVLRPLIMRARKSDCLPTPQKLQITDLFSLLFLISFFLAPFSGLGVSRVEFFVPVFVFFLVIAVLVWFTGLKAVNDLGICCWKRRGVAIGFVFPVGMLSGFINLILLFRLIDGRNHSQQILTTGFLLGIASWIIALIAIWGLAVWVASGQDHLQLDSASG